MKRGQFVTIAMQGDYGKPRPALIVQSDAYAELPSIVVCPVSSDLQEDMDEFRIDVQPDSENGLRLDSQIMVDKIVSLPLTKVGKVIGDADGDVMDRVTRAMVVLLKIT
jgi:mRNA interferase MazF